MKVFKPWAGRLFPPFLLGLGISAVQAGDSDDAWQLEADGIETVHVTAIRKDTTTQEIAVAVTALSIEQIFTEAPDVLPKMLRGLPGTYFQQTTPGQGIPIIRGLKGSQILHLVDGMRVNNAFFRDAPNQYLGLIDPFAMARVEVIRGSAGSLYGADAMGGVVNFISPEIDFKQDNAQSTRKIYGSWNSVDAGLVFRAQATTGKSDQGISGGVSWQNHSNRKTGSGTRVSHSAYRSEAADLKWRVTLKNDADLTLSAQLLEQPSTPRADELTAGFGQDQASSARFLYQPNRRSFIHARYRSDSSTTWLDHYQVNVARQVITDDRLTQDFGATVIREEENESTLDGITAQFDSVLIGGTQFIWGIEYYTDTVRSSRRATDADTGSSEVVRSRFPDNSTMDSTTVYASASWHPAERWTLGSGLRYSRFDIHLPAVEEVPETRLSPDDITGDVRFVYALNSTVNLVGNAGRGFRPPNIFDLGTLGNRPGNRFNIANPELRPESVLSYDLGVKTQSATLQTELFVFALQYRNKISSVATGEITESGRIIVRSENLAEAKFYGIEAGFRWSSDSGAELYGSLNYTHGEETANGDSSPADRIPPLNGKLGLIISANERLKMDAYILFSGSQDRLSQRDVADPRINPLGSPGWLTVNLQLAWEINPRAQAGIRLENLADRHYREHGSGIDAPGKNIGAWAAINF